MSDQVAISNLIYAYARLIDLGDFAGIGDLFQRGKIIFKDSEQITEISGSKEIKELYEKICKLSLQEKRDILFPLREHLKQNHHSNI